MGIRVMHENSGSRTRGFAVKSGDTVYPGLVVQKEDNDTIKIPTTLTEPMLGLALDSNVLYPFQATAPDTTAGEGYNYLDYNRQGLVAYISNAEVELYDDKRAAAGASHPVDYSKTYAVNEPVYVIASGKIDNATSGNTQVGVVTAVENNGSSALVLRVKLTI